MCGEDVDKWFKLEATPALLVEGTMLAVTRPRFELLVWGGVSFLGNRIM